MKLELELEMELEMELEPPPELKLEAGREGGVGAGGRECEILGKSALGPQNPHFGPKWHFALQTIVLLM